MAKNPGQYGLDDINFESPVPYEAVKIDYSVDLRLVAQCIDTPVSDVQDLNPSLLRLVTPKDQPFELHLPVGTKGKYLASIEPIPPNMRLWWRYHKVAPGDTLTSVARFYRVSPKVVMQENGMTEDAALSPESRLIIPLAAGKKAAEDGSTYARRATRYRVHPSDTVETVADNFGVSSAMVRRWNHLRGNSLSGRRVVYVHLPVAPGTAAAETREAEPSHGKKRSHKTDIRTVTHHTVKSGETLTSIASTYRTSVADLKRDNGNVASLRPGMVLLVRR